MDVDIRVIIRHGSTDELFRLPQRIIERFIGDRGCHGLGVGHWVCERDLGDIGSRCLPTGMPRAIIAKNYPDEIVQTSGQVTIFVFNFFPTVIWTDGRGHPKDLAPSYNGHSTGHWVGDTLFVDTVGIKEETPLDGMRNPHSAKLHVKWTIQRVAKDVLHFHITLHDEDAFTEPVVMTSIWHRKDDPRWQILDDASCFENLKTSPDAAVTPGFIKF